jgi:hypothetical protein
MPHYVRRLRFVQLSNKRGLLRGSSRCRFREMSCGLDLRSRWLSNASVHRSVADTFASSEQRRSFGCSWSRRMAVSDAWDGRCGS